jgi:2-C-methyl-D-erythritol 4-phosphate cytidylyltransferase
MAGSFYASTELPRLTLAIFLWREDARAPPCLRRLSFLRIRNLCFLALAVPFAIAAGAGLRPLHPAMYTSRVMQVFAILPAAGLGTRMAGPQPKQFLSLDGVPILIHSLRAFAEVRRVSSIWVAVRKPEMERVQAQVAEFRFGSRVEVVEGGENRQESVAHALAALPADEDDIVLVHDAVRPLIDAATIERTIDAVIEHGAAIVGMPAVDTIKQVERTAHGALITSTIPREFIVLAQTPQGFRYGVLKSAFTEAMADGFVGTDEASVVERAGHPVAVVPGSQVNLKITQPGDLELAEFYLRQRMPAGARNLG